MGQNLLPYPLSESWDRVKEAFAPTLTSIIKNYGDIAANCFMKTPEGRSLALENLSGLIQTFQAEKFCELPQLEIQKAIALVDDFRIAGLDVDWLQERLNDMLDAKQLIGQSSTLKERIDKSNQVIKEKKRELQVYEPQLSCFEKK
ncbi:hypothetical protein JCGZ_08291 [Jatropha curcas]|uniref:Uncharacterized protein n=1 Tax=Jatropha curcas TaxID=180498 RepID=A0A067KYW0_JATCU|nr:uncharacterized protein LOC119369952 [Jatropha curcas]KDP37450.1 hypothetical protein JCGZ_08291 [Jatropha curcas]